MGVCCSTPKLSVVYDALLENKQQSKQLSKANGDSNFLRGKQLQKLADFEKADYDYDTRPNDDHHEKKLDERSHEASTSAPRLAPMPKFEDAFQGSDFAYIFLLTNCNEEISVDDLAKMCSLSFESAESRIRPLMSDEVLQQADVFGGCFPPLEKQNAGPPDNFFVVMPDSVHEKLMKSAHSKFLLPQQAPPCDIRFRILTVLARHVVQGDFDDINVVIRLFHKAAELKLSDLTFAIISQFKAGLFEQFRPSTIVEDAECNPATWTSNCTALSLVCQHTDVDLVHFVYQFWPGAIKIVSEDLSVPLHLAAKVGEPSIVEFIYKKHPDAVKMPDKKGNTPLHKAALREGKLKVVEFLWEKYPEAIKTKNEMGDLPLHLAALSKNNIKTIKFLTEKWPDALQITDEEGYLPLHCAAELADLEAVRYLYERWPEGGLKIDKLRLFTPFCQACYAGKVESAIYLGTQCPETLPKADEEGNTPLHLAFEYPEPSMELVRFLLDRCPECIGQQNNEGNTPLHLLIERTPDDDGKAESPFALQKLDLVMEMAGKCSEVVKKVNADPGWTPLRMAYQEENKEIFCFLAEFCPKALLIKDATGNTILHEIALGPENEWTWAEFIMETCPKAAGVCNNEGFTPLHLAESFGFGKFAIHIARKHVKRRR